MGQKFLEQPQNANSLTHKKLVWVGARLADKRASDIEVGHRKKDVVACNWCQRLALEGELIMRKLKEVVLVEDFQLFPPISNIRRLARKREALLFEHWSRLNCLALVTKKMIENHQKGWLLKNAPKISHFSGNLNFRGISFSAEVPITGRQISMRIELSSVLQAKFVHSNLAHFRR